MSAPVRRWFSLLFFALIPSSLLAQAGTIQGTVRDSIGNAMAGVQITVDGTGLRATSDPRGGFILRGVPPGPRIVRARQTPWAGCPLVDRQVTPRVTARLARGSGDIKAPDLFRDPRQFPSRTIGPRPLTSLQCATESGQRAL